MEKEVAVSVSSVTGNTELIAQGVMHEARGLGWNVVGFDGADAPDADVVIVCFWCFRSTLDPRSMKRVEACSGKRILAVGTFGGFPTGAYADKVRRNVAAAISERNECLGVFLCQGKVKSERIQERRLLPEGDPHHLDDWGVVRLEEGQNHPNATDVLYARAFIHDFLPED